MHLPCKKKVEAFLLSFEWYLEFFAALSTFKIFVYFLHDFLWNLGREALLWNVKNFVYFSTISCGTLVGKHCFEVSKFLCISPRFLVEPWSGSTALKCQNFCVFLHDFLCNLGREALLWSVKIFVYFSTISYGTLVGKHCFEVSKFLCISPRFLVQPWSGSTALKCQSQGRDNEFQCHHRATYWLLRRRPLIVNELVNWRRSVCSASFVFSTRRTLNSRWRTAQKDGPGDILRIRWIRISNLGPETRLWCSRNFVQSFHVNMKLEVRLPDQTIRPYHMEPTGYFYTYEIGHDMCCCIGVVNCVWNVMAHAQKSDFVFRRNGRVHLNRRGVSSVDYWQPRYAHQR